MRYLIFECIGLFVLLPPALAAAKPHGWMYVSLWIFAVCSWMWLRKQNVRLSTEWNACALTSSRLRFILWRFVPIALALMVFTYFMIPEQLFSLPLERPRVWVMVILFYPLLSVIPQEIVFRSFFFRRYALLFKTPRMMIVASSIAFGWVHILLMNPVAVIFSALGGIIFSHSYQQTRSLAVACFEHALYGCVVFTLGLGFYFYHGMAVK